MKKLIVLVLVALIGVFFGSPYFAAYQMKQAIEKHDGAALANTIDYPQLTKNISDQLSQKLDTKINSNALLEQFAGDELSSFGHSFIDSSVSGALTKENIETLVRTQGQVNQSTKQLAAIWAIVSGKVELGDFVKSLVLNGGNIKAAMQQQIETTMEQQTQDMQIQLKQDDSQPKLSYCAIDCFTISAHVKGYPLTLEMQRQGLIGWKIVNVVLP